MVPIGPRSAAGWYFAARALLVMRKASIRTRFLIVLVLVVVISVGASALAALYLGRQALERTAFDKLTAVRELKADQIEDYFRRIRNQAVVFSDAPTIVEATRGFREAYRSIAEEVRLDAKRLHDLDQRLRRHYQEEFLPRLSANMQGFPSVAEFWPSGGAARLLVIPDVHWALMSEMDRAEAFAGVRALQRSMLGVLALVVAASVLLAIFLPRGLTRPLLGLTARANELAEGQLDVEIDTRREDEIGHLARSLDTMRKSVKSLVERQEAAIDALSTPLIPLRAGVVLMPLVGDFDRGRIERLGQALVQGVHDEGARVTIIDITGISGFDHELGRGLARVSAAARLLGAAVVLTRVQPEIPRGRADAGERLSDVQPGAPCRRGSTLSSIT